MKIGDLVIINVPMPSADTTPDAVQGMIIDKSESLESALGMKVRNRTWWYVLRSDTGTIQKFHEDWMEAGENGSW